MPVDGDDFALGGGLKRAGATHQLNRAAPVNDDDKFNDFAETRTK